MHAWEKAQPQTYVKHIARARDVLRIAHLERHARYNASAEQAHVDRVITTVRGVYNSRSALHVPSLVTLLAHRREDVAAEAASALHAQETQTAEAGILARLRLELQLPDDEAHRHATRLIKQLLDTLLLWGGVSDAVMTEAVRQLLQMPAYLSAPVPTCTRLCARTCNPLAQPRCKKECKHWCRHSIDIAERLRKLVRKGSSHPHNHDIKAYLSKHLKSAHHSHHKLGERYQRLQEERDSEWLAFRTARAKRGRRTASPAPAEDATGSGGVHPYMVPLLFAATTGQMRSQLMPRTFITPGGADLSGHIMQAGRGGVHPFLLPLLFAQSDFLASTNTYSATSDEATAAEEQKISQLEAHFADLTQWTLGEGETTLTDAIQELAISYAYDVFEMTMSDVFGVSIAGRRLSKVSGESSSGARRSLYAFECTVGVSVQLFSIEIDLLAGELPEAPESAKVEVSLSDCSYTTTWKEKSFAFHIGGSITFPIPYGSLSTVEDSLSDSATDLASDPVSSAYDAVFGTTITLSTSQGLSSSQGFPLFIEGFGNGNTATAWPRLRGLAHTLEAWEQTLSFLDLTVSFSLGTPSEDGTPCFSLEASVAADELLAYCWLPKFKIGVAFSVDPGAQTGLDSAFTCPLWGASWRHMNPVFRCSFRCASSAPPSLLT